jgi:hypothetical protein
LFHLVQTVSFSCPISGNVKITIDRTAIVVFWMGMKLGSQLWGRNMHCGYFGTGPFGHSV